MCSIFQLNILHGKESGSVFNCLSGSFREGVHSFPMIIGMLSLLLLIYTNYFAN